MITCKKRDYMTIKKLLGLRIKELRKSKNLTQAELAKLVSIDPKHQSCIENGRNFPSAELINKYAKVFDISECELIRIEHNINRDDLEDKLINKIKQCDDNAFRLIYKVVMPIIESK